MDVRTTLAGLERQNIKAHLVQDKDEARGLVMSMISQDDIVGAGGSVTLKECGIYDELKDYNFLDWFGDVTPEQKKELLLKTMDCDVFLMSSNAITESGQLFNVDGRGNRLAAMMFGPKKVIVVAGKNKIVSNLYEARERMDTIAAPLNCKRLNKNTPCVEQNKCVDCDSPDRICRFAVTTERQAPGRMEVIIVNENLGY